MPLWVGWGEEKIMADTLENLMNFLLLLFLCVLVAFIFTVDFFCSYCDYRNLHILGIVINFKVKISVKKTKTKQNLYIKEGANNGLFKS